MSTSQANASVRLAQAGIIAAARLMPRGTRERFLEEWLAELEQYQQEGMPLVPPALRILCTAPAIRRALDSAARGAVDLPVWRALSGPSFRYYFLGSVCADVGTWVRNTALILLAFRMTHSILAVGLIMSAQFAAPVVLAGWTAVIIERFGTRTCLMGARLLGALIDSILALGMFTQHVNFTWVAAFAIEIGVISAFAHPAASVLALRTVEADHARTAYTATFLSANLGRAAGPLLGLAITSFIGYGYAFMFASFSSLAICVFTSFMNRGCIQDPRRRLRVRDPLRIAWVNRPVLAMLAVAAAVTTATTAPLISGPALAMAAGVPVASCSFFLAALGGGAALVSIRPVRRPSLTKISCYLAVLSASAFLFALIPTMWVSLCAASVMGSASLLASATAYALVTSYVRRDYGLATIPSIWAVAFVGAGSIASLIDCSLAQIIGVRFAGMLIAAPAAIMAVLLTIKLPSRRRRNMRDKHASRALALPAPLPYPVPDIQAALSIPEKDGVVVALE